ncbi:DUF2946 domain-containing protein [uncultured Oxalicibacterium sp.]|uniref:DUF2946 domain-containing protein n=1 Tax=uncultured Oxalicibacterium sp. TaxID=1168540 RepID=UPI0025D241D4|nr:DUF2946 domain-containing protein [uncultured Oxalicibacterium sp.]
MKITATMHRCAAWIACLAILMAALAPAISHAMASHAAHKAWVEICTEQGSKMIQVTDHADPVSPSDSQHLGHVEHCPFCKTSAFSATLPPVVPNVLATIEPVHTLPLLYYHAPGGQFVWNVAASRAPPAHA